VVADAEVVDEVAGFEVVGAVEYDVRGEEGGGVLGDQVGDVGVDADAGVDAGEVAAGGFGFGEGGARVGFVEEHLALEVGGFYEVAVDEGKAADASAGEEAGGGGSGGADSDDGDVGAGEELLAGRADGGEEDLAGVAVGIWDWVCVGDGRVVGGERRHKRSIRFAENRSRATRVDASAGEKGNEEHGGDESVGVLRLPLHSVQGPLRMTGLWVRWESGGGRGSVANPRGVDCICKMKLMRDGRKPCVLRLCGRAAAG